MQIARLTALLGTVVLLAACAKKPAPPSAYDPAKAAEAQAASFIAPADKNADKNMKAAKKLAITSCNVMFAQVSSASASTAAGLFGNAGDTKRAEAKVSVYYSLVGMEDKDMQRMTDAICADAETKLKKAGFDLVPKSDLAKNAAYVELQKSGRPSPFEYKGGAGGGLSKYKVFAPGGATVTDERYIGTVSGLGQAFKAAKGVSAAQYEARVMDELKADAVNINILVDFAELQSSGNKTNSVAQRNTAEVKSSVGLSVNGQLRVKIAEGMKCWERFGKRECGLDAGKWPAYATKRPVFTGEKFYERIVNATTTGDKVGAALTKGLAMLAGGTSVEVTRYNVEVKPGDFEAISRRSIDGFVDMAVIRAKMGDKAGK